MSKHISSGYTTTQTKPSLYETPKEEIKRNFGVLLYECYKPDTLKDAQDYISHILSLKNLVKPNEVEEFEYDEENPENATRPIQGVSQIIHKNQSLTEYFTALTNRNESIKKFSKKYLIFDSNFECGNLEKAVARSETEYDIYVCSDTNSFGRCQWFYFKVGNTKKASTVRFNIINITKNLHFYKLGMKPLSFSEIDYSRIYLGWTEARTDNVTLNKLSGFPTKFLGPRTMKIPWEELDSGKHEYSNETEVYVLSFSHTFKHDNDSVYFALHKPFSYSRMSNFLNRIETKLLTTVTSRKNSCHFSYNPTPLKNSKLTSKLKKSKRACEKSQQIPSVVEIKTKDIYYKRETITYSLGKIPVEMVTITSPNLPEEVELNDKTYIVITARVHAAETAGSYKAQGLIRALLKNDDVTKELRKNHVFIIFPTLNPDGVIMGNNRCSLSGTDLNRCWGNPHQKSHPEIHKVKAILNNLCNLKKSQILLYCDMHGHSRLLNSFVYACHQETGTLCSWTQSRLLPRLLAKQTHLLDFHQCSFRVEPEKINTARVIVWKEFKVVNSFTLETSQYAYKVGDDIVRFTERDYALISEALLQAIHTYNSILPEIHNDYMDDWLKPCNLLELAGIPAADILTRELEESKAEMKRKQRKDKLREKCKKLFVAKQLKTKEKSRAASSLGNYRTTENIIIRNSKRNANCATGGFILPKTNTKIISKKPTTIASTRIESNYRTKTNILNPSIPYISNTKLGGISSNKDLITPIINVNSIKREKSADHTHYNRSEGNNFVKKPQL